MKNKAAIEFQELQAMAKMRHSEYTLRRKLLRNDYLKGYIGASHYRLNDTFLKQRLEACAMILGHKNV